MFNKLQEPFAPISPKHHFSNKNHKEIEHHTCTRQKDEVALHEATLQHHTTHLLNDYRRKSNQIKTNQSILTFAILRSSGDVRGSKLKSFPWAHKNDLRDFHKHQLNVCKQLTKLTSTAEVGIPTSLPDPDHIRSLLWLLRLLLRLWSLLEVPLGRPGE